jgi:hypothetical protein
MKIHGSGVETLEARQIYWWPVKGESVFCVALPWFSPLLGAQIRFFLLPFYLSYTHAYNGEGIWDLENGAKCYDADLNFFGCGMLQAIECSRTLTTGHQATVLDSFSLSKSNHLI